MNGMAKTSLDQSNDNSGSYNGRRAVSETDNEGPIPSPGAQCLNTGKISLNGLHIAQYVFVQLLTNYMTSICNIMKT